VSDKIDSNIKLSLIAVEKKAASKLDLHEVIDQFGNIKALKKL